MRKSGGRESQYKRGLWTVEEDRILLDYIQVHGKGKWNRVAKMTGLKRCGKSCRLRWMNYLSPAVKKGDFSEEEDDLIIRLHNLLGNRWSLIAGRVPGRTDNQVKNHWNTHLSRKLGVVNKDGKFNSRPSTSNFIAGKIMRDQNSDNTTPSSTSNSGPPSGCSDGGGMEQNGCVEINATVDLSCAQSPLGVDQMSDFCDESFWFAFDPQNFFGYTTPSIMGFFDEESLDFDWHGL